MIYEFNNHTSVPFHFVVLLFLQFFVIVLFKDVVVFVGGINCVVDAILEREAFSRDSRGRLDSSVPVEVALSLSLGLRLGDVKSQATAGLGAGLRALLLVLVPLDYGPHTKGPLTTSAHAFSEPVDFNLAI